MARPTLHFLLALLSITRHRAAVPHQGARQEVGKHQHLPPGEMGGGGGGIRGRDGDGGGGVSMAHLSFHSYLISNTYTHLHVQGHGSIFADVTHNSTLVLQCLFTHSLESTAVLDQTGLMYKQQTRKSHGWPETQPDLRQDTLCLRRYAKHI